MINRCFQNLDFKTVDVVIKENEKQKRHFLVDYYPPKSDCSFYFLTQIPNSEQEGRKICKE